MVFAQGHEAWSRDSLKSAKVVSTITINERELNVLKTAGAIINDLFKGEYDGDLWKPKVDRIHGGFIALARKADDPIPAMKTPSQRMESLRGKKTEPAQSVDLTKDDFDSIMTDTPTKAPRDFTLKSPLFASVTKTQNRKPDPGLYLKYQRQAIVTSRDNLLPINALHEPQHAASFAIPPVTSPLLFQPCNRSIWQVL